jgi:hypothetical protein
MWSGFYLRTFLGWCVDPPADWLPAPPPGSSTTKPPQQTPPPRSSTTKPPQQTPPWRHAKAESAKRKLLLPPGPPAKRPVIWHGSRGCACVPLTPPVQRPHYCGSRTYICYIYIYITYTSMQKKEALQRFKHILMDFD